MRTPRDPIYAGHRYPAEIISYAVWLYFRFPLSLRMVEEMLAARGISVTHETIRSGALNSPTAFVSARLAVATSGTSIRCRVGPGSFTPSTGSPEAVARPRFPQNVACGFPAPTLFGSCFTALQAPAAPGRGGAV